jgi:hypothetical protein
MHRSNLAKYWGGGRVKLAKGIRKINEEVILERGRELL